MLFYIIADHKHNLTLSEKKVKQKVLLLSVQNHDRLCVRFPFEEIKYLIFSILRSGVEAKRGVKFHHLTCEKRERNILISLFISAYPAVYGI